MSVLFFDETPDHPAFAAIKYQIGDRIKVIRVKTSDPSNYEPETLAVFKACVGRRFRIKEILAFETTEDDEYLITYGIHVAHLNGEPNSKSYLETVYLDDDEIAPIKKRK